jgi:hypothetical protein
VSGQVRDCGLVTAGTVDEKRGVDVVESPTDLPLEVRCLFVAEKPRVRSPVGIDLAKDTIERLANAPVTAFVRSQALVDVLLDIDVLRGNPFVYVFVYPSTFATPYATGRE